MPQQIDAAERYNLSRIRCHMWKAARFPLAPLPSSLDLYSVSHGMKTQPPVIKVATSRILKVVRSSTNLKANQDNQQERHLDGTPYVSRRAGSAHAIQVAPQAAPLRSRTRSRSIGNDDRVADHEKKYRALRQLWMPGGGAEQHLS